METILSLAAVTGLEKLLGQQRVVKIMEELVGFEVQTAPWTSALLTPADQTAFDDWKLLQRPLLVTDVPQNGGSSPSYLRCVV